MKYEYERIKWFAWYPVKTLDGWTWLKYIWKHKYKQPTPTFSFLFDEEYRKRVLDNWNP